MDGAEAVCHLLEKAVHRLRAGDVAGDVHGLHAVAGLDVLYILRQLFLGGGNVHQRYLGTQLRQPGGGGAADAAGRPGDQRRLALQ